MNFPLLIAVFLLIALTFGKRAFYEPAPLQVESTTDPSGLWDLKHHLSCTGGMGQENDGMYSSNRGPGGYCASGAFMKGAQTYTIKDGIGGSLLTK